MGSSVALSEKQKSNFWQIIRGICILAVIMIHCPSGVSYGVGSKEFIIWLSIRQLINFPVATFIFLSGYFTNINKCQSNCKMYVLSRGKRLLIPYLIWSVFYSLVSIVQTVHSGGVINWKGIIYRIVVGKACTPLYYIVVLIQLTFLTPMLIKVISKKRMLRRFLWLLTPAYLVFIYGYNISLGKMPKLYATFFPAWFIFYYLGLHIKLNSAAWKKNIQRFGKPHLVILAILLSMAESFLLVQLGCDSSFVSSQIKISSFLYSTILIIYIYKRKECTESKDKKIYKISRRLLLWNILYPLLHFDDCRKGAL